MTDEQSVKVGHKQRYRPTVSRGKVHPVLVTGSLIATSPAGGNGQMQAFITVTAGALEKYSIDDLTSSMSYSHGRHAHPVCWWFYTDFFQVASF